MTKAELVSQIANRTGVEKVTVLNTIEAFMEVMKDTMSKGENVYLRGFGSFILKRRAEKIGRNITRNVSVKIPAHYIPAFKPAKPFSTQVKNKVKA
jgi:DNA-binding protein HU-beta